MSDHNNTPDNQDFLNMSDEDIMNMSVPEWDIDESEDSVDMETEDTEVLEEESFEAEDLEDMEDTDSEEEDFEEEDAEEDTEEDEDEDVEESLHEDEDDAEEEEDVVDEDSEEDEDEDEEDNSAEDDTNYKAMYEELMAPFKANKREIKVSSPEELRRLAQMGVGYNAKMAEIKPLRKIGKMLENAGLLDEDKINYLIDLSKNDTGAINKLIKDSGIDPLDLDTEGTEYSPNTYNVNDNQLDLSDTLKVLGETESGRTVITEVDQKWDEASKEVLLQNPNMLTDLEGHVESGLYNEVMNIVENERALGKVPQGVTDLQAYTHVVQHLAQQKAQAEAAKQAEEAAKPKVKKKPKVVKKNKLDAKRNKLRQAAATSRSKSTKSSPEISDILNMSDEEFEKKFS